MDTILLVQITGNTWQRLDLYEDVPITLTIQQSDLTNLTSRRAPYSKTITLPGTSNNDLLLEHYFEVNGYDFNPLQKISCVVQYRGTDIFQGVLRLNSVQTVDEYVREYEVFILGEVSDFASEFRNLQLQDLDYTDLVHELTYSAITTSWENVNDGNSGLFNGQILYPLINYGLDYQGDSSSGASPTFTYSFGEPRSFDQASFPVPPSMFKPAIQLKSILNRIFDQTSYKVVSDFFDSEYFTSIYMDTFQNGKTGVEYASGVTNQNIFKANGLPQQIRYEKDDKHKLNTYDLIGDAYDPLGNFFNSGGEDNGNFFRAPFAGNYGFNVAFNIQLQDLLGYNLVFPMKVQLQAFSSRTQTELGQMIYASNNINLNQALVNPLPVNLFFDEDLIAGDIIQIRLVDMTPYVPLGINLTNPRIYTIAPFSQGGVEKDYVFWDLYQSPQLITSTVDMALGIPNIECLEFIRSLITMFNLVIIQDEVKKEIRMEPYNTYFNDSGRVRRDFTQILDTSTPFKIEPLSYDLSKDVTWTYTNTEFEYLPKLFRDRFDYNFGRQKFSSESNILAGEQVYELPFVSCPTSGVTGAPNFIIPQYYYLNNQQQAPYATKPHLFFWVGNRYCYKDIYKSVQGSWYLLSGGTAVEWNTYPCVSHLSTLESQIPNVVSDLNFASTFDFFGNTTTYINQFTQYTLYNSFWRTYINNLYSPYGKRFTGNFYYKPIDVYETKLNDKVWIKDSWFTIEKITDADLVNKKMTQISLIKDVEDYYEINPPTPIYVYSPNEPYPSPEPFYYSTAYISTNQGEVCSGTTSGITTFYSFGTGILGNLDQVYLDNGTSYVLLPIGTYIRQTTSSTTFVCIDNYGRVLETTC